MNKQALAFLTMFSLVLMLSVYYVTLPSDTAKVVTTAGTNDKTKKQATNTSKEEKKDTKTTVAKSDQAAVLQEQIDQSKETQINQCSKVVADKDSKEKEKQEALATMEEVKSQKELQASIKTSLGKEKINAAIELKDDTCTVSVFDKKKDKTVATDIMKIVNTLTNNKYLIEVTFK